MKTNCKPFVCSTQGADHIRRGVVCQDAVGSFEDSLMNIAVVSDGHGSAQYFRSDMGAKFVVEAAIESLKGFVSSLSFNDNDDVQDKIPFSHLCSESARSDIVRDLVENILVSWHEKVDLHYKNNPFEDEILDSLSEKYKTKYRSGKYVSAYGATMIAIVQTDYFWMCLQIGDGIFVKVDDKYAITMPLPLDDECQNEVTTSICQDNALSKFHYVFGTDIPVALYAASDGVDDSYDDDEMLKLVYRGITTVFGKGYDYGFQEVKEYLPVITKNGKGDDTSMIGIINLDSVSDCAAFFRNQIEEEQQKNNSVASIENNDLDSLQTNGNSLLSKDEDSSGENVSECN